LSRGGDFKGTDRFDVITRLGAGGMGIVYQVLDRDSGTPVALKTLQRLSGDSLLRFKNEFRSLHDLEHPNLVSLGELIEEHGQWFMTMELVDGVDFLSWVRGSDWERKGSTMTSSRDELEIAASVAVEGFETARTQPSWTGPGERPPMKIDPAHLRRALAQLVRGVLALHDAGKVHRDIKPSNVLVTPEGRVVLLDFGCVTSDTGEERLTGEVIGTVDYMAPEQAAASPDVGPEADWYAVGVLLYEALTGQVPIDGHPMDVLMRKQRVEPTAPSEWRSEVPEDLDRLCVDLLQIDPAKRPKGREILERIGERSERAETTRGGRSASFIGRAHELETLHRLYRETRGSHVVVIEGESGVGKSALCARFLDELGHEHPDLVVLRGRCYERESVPYKAFDGVIDALCRLLLRLPDAEVIALLPQHAGFLAEVFPVLRRVRAVARLTPAPLRLLEAQEQRRRLFVTVRELFENLAFRWPVLVVIDDLQWADGDSFALVRELTAPLLGPRLFLVGTARTAQQRPDGHAVLDQLQTVEHMRLSPLPGGEAHELATQLARALAPSLLEAAESLAADAGGNPLFIEQLVRYAEATGKTATNVHLDDALWERVTQLQPETRALLEALAVAGAPVEQGTLAAAAGVPFIQLGKLLGGLRAKNLVRTSGARKGDSADAFHDRVREAIWQRLPVEKRRDWHERLARALEATESAPSEALARHWLGAGDAEKALVFARRAAEEAARALAFDQAARLWRVALEMESPQGASRWELQAGLSEALANAGRCAEAANAMLSAAQLAPPERAVELNRRAAEQLLMSGHVDSGLEVLRRVLDGVKLSMPRTPNRALVSLLVRRAQVNLRGLKFRARAVDEIPAEELTRVDTCWSVSVGLGIIDTIRGAYFQSQHLLLALRVGERRRIARALAIEAAYRSTGGVGAYDGARRVLAESARLAEQLGDPTLLGLVPLVEGIVGFLVGRWGDALELFEQAERVLSTCNGVAWELDSARMLRLWALFYLGELAELRRSVPPLVDDAEERGDLYALTSVRVCFEPMVCLFEDDPARARKTSAEALARWSQAGFHFQHYFELFAHGLTDLYAGDGADAHRYVESKWPALKASLLLEVQQNGLEAYHLRGRCALAAGELARAEKEARRLLRSKIPWAVPLGEMLAAGLAATRGRRDEAQRLLARAVESLAAAGMRLYEAAARRRLGELSGTDGAAEIARADRYFTSEGVRDPARMTAMLAPGF
jgi:serine/threonine protein kinase/tetratricopeptide (TPR) repeat protein